MKVFNIPVLSLATLLAASAVSAAVDWTSAGAQACATQNWSAIKAAVDPNILRDWDFIPDILKSLMEQSGALNADHTLISNPTADQIVAIARGFPSGIFSPYGDNIVQKCLDDGGAVGSTTEEEPEPTTTEEEPEPTTTEEEPEPTTTEDVPEPTTTEDVPEPTTTEEEPEPTTTEEEPEPTTTDEETTIEEEPTTTDEEPATSSDAAETTSADEQTESSDVATEEESDSSSSAEDLSTGNEDAETTISSSDDSDNQETATSSAPLPTNTDTPKCIPRPVY
ncbi:hypothetical protein IWW48_004024 [Coemansia sp. RSA 1200]|nr:hypothetical protein IWW48_004024 [Coemansia sp. RSA 1200]